MTREQMKTINLNDPSGFEIVVRPTYGQIQKLRLALFEADVDPNPMSNITTVLNAVKAAYEQQLENEQEYLIEWLIEDGQLKPNLEEVTS